jgi:hypothetical protein
MYFQTMNGKLHISQDGSGSFEYTSRCGLICTPKFTTIPGGRKIFDELKLKGEVSPEEHLHYLQKLDAWKPAEEPPRIIVPGKENEEAFAEIAATLGGKVREGGGIIPVVKMPRGLRLPSRPN